MGSVVLPSICLDDKTRLLHTDPRLFNPVPFFFFLALKYFFLFLRGRYPGHPHTGDLRFGLFLIFDFFFPKHIWWWESWKPSRNLESETAAGLILEPLVVPAECQSAWGEYRAVACAWVTPSISLKRNLRAALESRRTRRCLLCTTEQSSSEPSSSWRGAPQPSWPRPRAACRRSPSAAWCWEWSCSSWGSSGPWIVKPL